MRRGRCDRRTDKEFIRFGRQCESGNGNDTDLTRKKSLDGPREEGEETQKRRYTERAVPEGIDKPHVDVVGG